MANEAGDFVRKHPIFVGLAAVTLLFWVATAVAPSRTERVAKELSVKQPQAATTKASAIAACQESRQALIARHAELTKIAKHEEASHVFGACADASVDPLLAELAKRSTELKYLTTANDPKRPLTERSDALNALFVFSPEAAKGLESMRKTLNTKADAARAADNKKLERERVARKRKEGVNIGMSKQDVLESSWGRPSKINTSTYRFGTHEQWVL